MWTKMTAAGFIFAMVALPLALRAAEPATEHRAHSPAIRTLDLKAPEVARIFSIEQINAVLSRAVDPELERVEVEAPRIGDLPLQDNSASTAEVIFMSVVRWFAPAHSYAARVNIAPDATNPYRPAPLLQANYHASFAPPASQR